MSSANVVISRLNMIFARQRYTTIVKTNNGPSFQEQDFKDFATQSGFRLRRIILWPEANGEAEHFVRTLKRYIFATTMEEFNWKPRLPHNTTRISVFETCTGRKINIGLPDTPKNPASRPIHDRIAGNDSKGKEIMKWYADRNKKTKQNKQSPHPSA